MGDGIPDPECRTAVELSKRANNDQVGLIGGFLDQAGLGNVVDERFIEHKRREKADRDIADTPNFVRVQYSARGVVRIVQQHRARRFRFDAAAETVHGHPE